MKPIQSSFLFALLFLGNIQAQTLKHNPKLEIFFETIVFENGDQYFGQTMFGFWMRKIRFPAGGWIQANQKRRRKNSCWTFPCLLRV